VGGCHILLNVGLRELIGKLEGLEALDGVSDRLAGAVNASVGPAKSLLSGTWLEHPLRPLLTDLPIGCWSGAVILDLFGGAAAADAVDPLVGLGALAAVPAVVSGLSDWADSYGPERRVGLVHAAAGVTGLGLFAASLLAGGRGARRLRLLGLTAVSAGGYLGGHLSFGRGVGVDHQAFLEKPSEWVDALDAGSLEEATPTLAEAAGARVLLYRRGTQIYAVSDVCPHAAGPLHEGTVDADLCVTCPWHGSRFRLSDGRAVRGPASAPATVYQARVEHGRVQVRAV
jgi:nitrite reductase/ring-hydroxylating ferredoxin subunit